MGIQKVWTFRLNLICNRLMLWTLLVAASKSGYGGAYGENYIYAGKDEFSQAACAGIDCDSI